MPDTDLRNFAFCDLPPTIFPSSIFGGIAQLVERQLCKLEVRGSNPLASSPESFRDCRAVASAKADTFNLATSTQRASTVAFSYGVRRRLGEPVMTKFFYVYILRSEADPQRFYT